MEAGDKEYIATVVEQFVSSGSIVDSGEVVMSYEFSRNISYSSVVLMKGFSDESRVIQRVSASRDFPHTRFLFRHSLSPSISVKMVKLALLTALAALSVGLVTGEQAFLSGGLLKTVLNRFGVNSTILDNALSSSSAFVRPARPHVIDITDENYELVLRTGQSVEPFAKSLPESTIWVSSFPLSKISSQSS